MAPQKPLLPEPRPHRGPSLTRPHGSGLPGRKVPLPPQGNAPQASPPEAPPMVQRALSFGPKPVAAGAVTTVEGEVLRVTFENEETGFRVLRVTVNGKEQPEVWVGVIPATPPGTRVRATGRYERDPRHGEQLKVDTLLTMAPSTVAGIERYLGSGMVPGVGPAYAKRIVEAFGEETLKILDQAPERLAEVPGLGSKRVEAVQKAWEKHRAVGAIMIFLQGHGVSPGLAARIFKRFGPKAIEIVSRSPYRLALDVWGVGFLTADRIAQSIGVGADAPERAQAGLLQMLHDLSGKGHVYADRSELVSQAAEMLNRPIVPVNEAVDALALSGHVKIEELGVGETAVYPTELYEAEVRLAGRVRALVDKELATSTRERLSRAVGDAIALFEQRTKVELAPAQREAVLQAAQHKVLVLTGGPGVGKTTIVRALISLFDQARIPVRLAAPTGRAAKRMSEATGREALTLHRLLEFDPKLRTFNRKHGRPIEAGAVIIDESSMLDLPLADALFQALSDDARVVLVGDVDQLPSVGPGAILRDVIASGEVPTVRLTQIFRQAEGSLIVQNAHRIHDGIPPESATGPDGEFYVLPRTGAEAAADAILQMITERIPQRFGFDPRSMVQVLTPMHKGEAGAIALNQKLQQALNPSGPEVTKGTRTLRLGDKVMQLKNDYDKEVYNGDMGFITEVDAATRSIEVRFDDRKVRYEESELDELTLAYATSIHKSQGSEYPCVIVPILTQHYVMLSRNLIYTAVTRGKKLVVLVADPQAVKLALAEVRKEERRTWLGKRIKRARAAG
ncbi:MAG: ATP-dependent RecD-like DNA helicase [Byssovorax sp.]